MEKYIIILVILATIYYIQNKFLIEGFEAAPAQSLGGIDDTNAINTLAQISRQLMVGGLKVPGTILVEGNIAVNGDFSSFGPTKKNRVSFHTPPDGRRALYIAPEKMDGSDWEWGNGLALDFKEKVFSTNSNSLTVGANLNVGGSMSTGGDLTFLNPTTIRGKARLHIGGEELLFLLNKSGVIVSNAWGGNGNLQVDGALTVSGRNILAELNALNAKTANLNLGKFRLTDEGVALTIRNSQRGDDRRYAFYHDGNWG